MKKVKEWLFLLGIMMILIGGCNSNKDQDFRIEKKDNFIIKKVAVESPDSEYSIVHEKYTSMIITTPKEVISFLNKKIEEAGIEITLEEVYFNYNSLVPEEKYYGFQGQQYINISTDTKEDETHGNIKAITLSLYPSVFKDRETTDYKERAKLNGICINALIEIFHPGAADKITEALYVFEKAPNNIPDIREVEYGNMVYQYSYSVDAQEVPTAYFMIRPKHISIENNNEDIPPAAIKP